MNIRTVSLFFFILLLSSICHAQNARLAAEYFSTGEYEKAADIYYKVFKKNKNRVYFDYYIKSLLASENYAEAEKALSKEIKKDADPSLFIIQGSVYESQGKTTEAESQYNKAIEALSPNRNQISTVANTFSRNTKYNYAEKTYLKGSDLLQSPYEFAYNLGHLYKRQGKIGKMVESYLLAIENRPSYMRSVQSSLLNNSTPNQIDSLISLVQIRMQSSPDVKEFPELLQWAYVQKKDYKKAMRQAKALDLRFEENGNRVYELANIAARAKNYKVAIKGYKYLLDNKPDIPYRTAVFQSMIKEKRNQITESSDYTQEELLSLKEEYSTFISEKGINNGTSGIMLNWAELEGLYLNNLEEASSILSKLIDAKGINKKTLNLAKLDLGDYYLMSGDIWEATLLYSQVDKSEKEGALGEQARFRNARLSYYNGDFEWAQSQFDVLKASTTKLISNDAIETSIFIYDNLENDTIIEPLQLYAKAELLAYQNKLDDSFNLLDTILTLYSDHGIVDDVYYAKANNYKRLRNFDKARDLFEKIVSDYAKDIRADNSLFALGELYEQVFDDPEKAKSYYKRLFVDYSNSTFAVEARKRFRILRGDNVNG